ncbi:MAG: Gldg family protein [Clostridia bacterium]|nr:Gldg family protein [Clostridia bacterium]
MKKQFVRNRKVRYGGITVILTVLVITVTVLANAVFSTLSERYRWYTYPTSDIDYQVTQTCCSLLDGVFNALEAEGEEPKVKILFCDTAANLIADSTERYVYLTATMLAERFPEQIQVECYNIWNNPTSVKQYNKTLDPTTGEEVETPILSTSVIIVSGEYSRVYALEEFYVFKEDDVEQLWAYNGEKKLAAGILRAVNSEDNVVGLINNHGEIFYDYEFLFLLDDAGYSVTYIDLYKDPIPADCHLLISYNPNADLTHDELSEVSEIRILEEYLSVAGNNFLVFVDNGTPTLPNFEAFLADWGVSFNYATDSSTGRTYRHMMQDSSQSLTSDGYTIYGQAVSTGTSGQILQGLDRNVVFKDATSIRAAQGYVNRGDGSYANAASGRVMYSLYRGGENAVAWANGKAVASGQGAVMMTVTEQTLDKGSSRVGVVASTDFATEGLMQSAVYGNTDVMMRVMNLFGRDFVPEGLVIKPFDSNSISAITTSQMLAWTIVLSVTPALVLTAVAVVVLVRRRRA